MALKKYNLEIAVFVCGAVVMIFELTGSRLLAPYLGSSIFVWTSLIGVIMGSLSLGYALGGRIADKRTNAEPLAFIILLASVFIGGIYFLQGAVAALLKPAAIGLELSSLLISLFLFAPASVLLGMVTPYVVKLKMRDLEKTGETAGDLYAISTVGSIAGTFAAGFFFIPNFGSTNIILLLSLTLIAVSFLLSFKFVKTRLGFALAVILIFWANSYIKDAQARNGFLDVDSQYNRVFIFESADRKSGRPTLNLTFDPFGTESAMFLDNPNELVFDYSKFFHLAAYFNPGFEKSLLLGGAAYSFPKNYLQTYPDALIDVVEIDPKLTELAKERFKLEENPRMRIFHEDGRVFLNSAEEKYDVIFGDAFQSLYSIPYQLTTKEAVERKYGILNDNGVVVLNLISSITGEKGKFLRAEYETYKSVFPQVYIFPVNGIENAARLQNIILVALKSEIKPLFYSDNAEFDKYLGHVWTGELEKDAQVLTDNFAPVDYYIREAI